MSAGGFWLSGEMNENTENEMETVAIRWFV